jgi:hypothetical protein
MSEKGARIGKAERAESVSNRSTTAPMIADKVIATSDQVPAPLRELRGWLVWRRVPDGKKVRKVPFYAGGEARRTHGTEDDRARLTTFDEAIEAAKRGGFDGIGLAMLPQWGLVALDFDHCVRDGFVDPRVEALVAGTYAELSPSGNGVRAFFRGALPDRKTRDVEVFHSAGYVTLTGRALDHIGLTVGRDDIAPVSPAVRALVGPPADNDEDPFAGLELPLGLSVEQLRSLLAVQDPSAPHDEWIRVGMALHHELAGSDEGFELFDQWSAKGDTYPGTAALRRRWDSFGRERGGSPVTARSLVKAAAERGVHLDVDRARATRGPLLVPLDESKPLRPLPSLIRGVLPADAVGMLWGEPGSFKSFLAIDWALCVATGAAWLGHPAKHADVWYLAGEGHDGLLKRVVAWRRARGIVEPLRFAHSTRALLLDDETGKDSPELRRLLAMIEEGGAPALIVVDTLARSMSGDESSTQDASRFVQVLDRLVGAVRSKGAECTVLLVHHARKDGTVYRGSSVLRGAVDFEYELTRGEAMTATLVSTKSKDAAAPRTLRLHATEVELGNATDEFGVESMVRSLVLEMDEGGGQPAPAIGQKAMRLLPDIGRVLAQFPEGASQRALTDALRSAGVKFDKNAIPGMVEFLRQHAHLAIETVGRAHRIRRLIPSERAEGEQGIAPGVA